MNILIAIIVLIILYICLNKIYRKYWNRGLNVELSFDAQVLTEDETGYITEIISNDNFLPIPSLWIKFGVDRSLIFKDIENVTMSDKRYKNDIFSIQLYQRIKKKLTFTASKRGYYTIDRIDVVASDLMLSDSLVTSVPCDMTLIVYPRLTDSKDIEIPFNRIMGEVISKRRIYADPFEFSRIRPYMQGDNPKDINWKATSKTGVFQTNVHEYTSGQEITFLFNPDSERLLRDDDLTEEGIRIIATLSTLFTAQGINVSFYTSAHDILSGLPSSAKPGYGKSHCEEIYRTLARLDLEADREEFVPFASKLLTNRVLNKESAIVLVSSAKDAKTCELFDSLHDRNNSSAFWILPLRSRDLTDSLPKSDRILHWEVKL